MRRFAGVWLKLRHVGFFHSLKQISQSRAFNRWRLFSRAPCNDPSNVTTSSKTTSQFCSAVWPDDLRGAETLLKLCMDWL
jgi:hypothetical protein